MTIEQIEQRCDACGARRAIPLAALRAGVEHGDPPQPIDPSVIALPVCPDCDAREFLVRVASPDPARRRVTEHARGVNAVHHALVAAGHVAPSLSRYFAGESAVLERAELPWIFEGEPSPIRGRTEPPAIASSQLLAARNGGG